MTTAAPVSAAPSTQRVRLAAWGTSLVALLAASAIAVLALAGIDPPTGDPMPLALALAIAAAGALLSVDLPVGRTHLRLHGGEVAVGALLFVARPEYVVVGAAVGSVVHATLHRHADARRAAVGVGATSLGAALGALVFHGIQAGDTAQLRSAVAVLAAGLTMAVAAALTVAVVRRLSGGMSGRELRNTLLGALGVGAIIGATATQLVVLGHHHPLLSVIGVLPLLLVSVASLSFGRQRREAEQSRLLKAVTRQLQDARVDEAINRATHAFRAGLDVDLVAIVIFGGARTVWNVVTPATPPDRGFSTAPPNADRAAHAIVRGLSGVTTLPGDRAHLTDALAAFDLVAAVGAPLLRRSGLAARPGSPFGGKGDPVIGLLVVGDHDPEKVADLDTEVVAMMATQVGMALERGFLARTVDHMQNIEAELQFQANHDSLTGLANRHLFDQRLDAILREHGTGLHALLLVDLDDFKPVNDLLGHPAGDELLRVVGRRIRYFAHRHDVVARLGGDEFGLVLTNLTHAGAATRRADDLLAALCQPTIIAGRELVPAASVGIAFSDPDRPDAALLVSRADMALYHAKRLGKGRWATFYEELEVRLTEQMQLAVDLEHAFERDEFELWYQPVVSLRDASVVGYEALVRWRHPTRGLLPPTAFLSSVADAGQANRLDRLVVERAAEMAVACRRDGRGALFVSVNVDGSSLLRAGFVEMVRATLERTGAPAASLVVEVGEADLAGRPARAGAVLEELSRLGVAIALDDFGVGPSSLATVRSLPLRYAKVDMMFLERIENGQRGSLAEPILQLAAGLADQVVAEGVETVQQAALVRAAGCHLAQGFYYGEPMPAEEAVDIVRQQVVPSAGTTNPTR
jgi:diguanylate cyclase (GGDEF)-like protein